VILACRDYAKDSENNAPPPELVTIWQCRRWNTLPNAGGILDQPAGMMYTLTQYARVYDAFVEYSKRELGKEASWRGAHPDEYAVIQRVKELMDGTRTTASNN